MLAVSYGGVKAVKREVLGISTSTVLLKEPLADELGDMVSKRRLPQ